MDARISRIVAALICGFCLTSNSTAQMVEVTTANFVIHAPDRGLAERAGKLAEQYRRDLSREWLGYEIKPWNEKCPVKIEMARLPGGETSFAFVPSAGAGQPVGWQMRIYGPPDRVLDAVLPHEITHTIFATHFGRPLPRWADEGACTTVEHASERAKNHQMLIEFLTAKPSRGIPFNRMFTMREYPNDILPLYAQGFSLAKFLIQQEGKRHFVSYIANGMKLSDQMGSLQAWDRATKESYGFANLSELQVSWMKWVERGSPAMVESRNPTTDLAVQEKPLDPNPAEPYGNEVEPGAMKTPESEQSHLAAVVQGSWYREQMSKGKSAQSESLDRRTAADAFEQDSLRNNDGYRPGSIADAPSEIILKRPATQQAEKIQKLPERTIWR